MGGRAGAGQGGAGWGHLEPEWAEEPLGMKIKNFQGKDNSLRRKGAEWDVPEGRSCRLAPRETVVLGRAQGYAQMIPTKRKGESLLAVYVQRETQRARLHNRENKPNYLRDHIMKSDDKSTALIWSLLQL